MIAIPFTIELLEPLLIAMPDGNDQNSAVSLSHIPGSVIRSALAGRTIAKRNIQDAALDPQCRRLFFDGACAVLNSYLVDDGKRRSLPIPLSWHAEKDAFADWKEGGLLECIDVASGSERPEDAKRVNDGEGYCIHAAGSDQQSKAVRVQRQFSVHIAHPNTREYDSKEKAQVYGYFALESGQTFMGAVLAPDEAAASAWRAVLADCADISIGGSRSAGYGRVHITALDTNDWREYEQDESVEDVAVFTLLSDAIVRDSRGQFTHDISAALGIKGEPRQYFVRSKLIGGFNNHWSLPTPQAMAISAGSVFVYKAADVERAGAAVQDALEKGIGERRMDGFGRIAKNWHGSDVIHLTKAGDAASRRDWSKPIESAASKAIARQIVNSRLRTMLDQKLIEQAARLQLKGSASASSLARVRLAARRGLVMQQGGLGEIRRLLDEVKGKVAATQLAKIRLGSQNLPEWLAAQADVTKDKTPLWQPGVNEGDLRKVSIANVTAELTPALHEEYTLRLIELVINRQIRAQRKQENKQ